MPRRSGPIFAVGPNEAIFEDLQNHLGKGANEHLSGIAAVIEMV